MERVEILGEFGSSTLESSRETDDYVSQTIEDLYTKELTLLADALSSLKERQLSELESALNMVGRDIRVMSKLENEEAERVAGLLNKLALLEDLADIRATAKQITEIADN